MARPKEFQRDDVLDKAMQVFWSKGFECTSMQDLVDAMGINRGSLYDTFGDKHSLHVAALERFYETEVPNMFAGLDGSGPVKPAIQSLFTEIAQTAAQDDDIKGCMISNTAAELCPDKGPVGDIVAAGLKRAEECLHRALVRARDSGEISADRNPRKLARHFLCSLNGMRVVAKGIDDPKTLDDMIEGTLSVLD